jgi:ATP-binding cassette, subfamily C, bacterial CydCD
MTTSIDHGTRSRLFDPRLLELTRSTRHVLALAVATGVATSGLVVAQAWLLADVVAAAVDDRRGVAALAAPLALLLGAVTGRAMVAWLSERLAQRSSASATSELRMELASAVSDGRGLRHAPGEAGALVVLATSGIDALDAYFGRYLPQVVLAVIVPVTVIAVVAGADWVSALILAVTVPLVPVFMGLVGASTAARTRRQMRTLQRLSGHFLDVVEGLPTLKVFGRARVQARAVRQMTDRYRVATMATLRVAFLSSLILELLATVSVALVAVAVGLRLLSGHLDFRTGLFVLVLAPEAYLPLRQLGAQFHASAEGLRAADDVFDVVHGPRPVGGGEEPVPDLDRVSLAVSEVTVTYPGRTGPALAPVSLRVEPDEVVALTGPSGSGKSTLLSVVLGLVPPSGGVVWVGSTDLARLDRRAWHQEIAWVPQRPHLFARSIADNIRIGRPGASDHEVGDAVERVGLADVVSRLPDGIETVLGDRGAGLSAGERQRVALARAWIGDARLLLLDEPTANLDGVTERDVLNALERLMEGRTVLLVAHRPALVAMADRVVVVGGDPAPSGS